jgi:glucokinase
VGDIGGTNARFALVNLDGGIDQVCVLACKDFDGLAEAYEYYCRQIGQYSTRLAIAVASPVDREVIRFTNNHWSFSKSQIRKELRLDELLLVNDFTAQALAVPAVEPSSYQVIQTGNTQSNSPILVIGPGTGLGVGGLIPSADGEMIPIVGEGGHVTLSATTDDEFRVLSYMKESLSHVSAERVVSGPGLLSIYEALCGLHNSPPEARTPSEVTKLAVRDMFAGQALELFSGFLGTVVSDACLTIGAKGGVVLAGGVIPKLGRQFPVDVFLERFNDKGRLSEYLETIEIKIQHHPEAALLGLARYSGISALEKYRLG